MKPFAEKVQELLNKHEELITRKKISPKKREMAYIRVTAIR